MTSDLRFYLALFWRRLPLFLLVFAPVTAISIFLALSLPGVYHSQMKLIVESSQIPDSLAQSTVTVPAKEQLQLFQTRLMTRDNLLQVANTLKPFANQATMAPDDIVQAMRDATTITSTSGRDQATVMAVTFDSRSAQMAQKVLEAYLTFLLNEDAQYRSQRAGQTQEFFQQEVDRLSAALNQQSVRIANFKSQNSDALPDSLDYHRNLLLALQDRLSQTEKDIASLTDQKQRLKQTFDLTGRVGSTNTGTLSPEEQRLQTLKAQLAEASAIYSPTSSQIVSLKARIDQLEASIARNNGGAVNGQEDPAKTVYDLQMSDIDTKLSQSQKQHQDLATQLSTLQDQIARTPANAVALDGLQRDYDNLQTQYTRASTTLAQASTGERIETLSRGQRMTVIDRPTTPDAPYKPNRKRLGMLGAIAGVVGGIGLILLLDMFSGKIKRSKDLINGLGMVPLVVIPQMQNEAEILHVRRQRIGLSLMIGICVPLILWVVHTYYMPFDVIASKVGSKIGLKF